MVYFNFFTINLLKITKGLVFTTDFEHMDIDISGINQRQRISPQNAVRNRSVSAEKNISELHTGNQSIEKSYDFAMFKDNLEYLIQSPEVREDIVDLGIKLAEDPGFPSDESLDEIAKIMISPIENFLSESEEDYF